MRRQDKQRARIGAALPITDRHGKPLAEGDNIVCGGREGILLYRSTFSEYVIAISATQWRGNDKYDLRSYARFFHIPIGDRDLVIEKKTKAANYDDGCDL